MGILVLDAEAPVVWPTAVVVEVALLTEELLAPTIVQTTLIEPPPRSVVKIELPGPALPTIPKPQAGRVDVAVVDTNGWRAIEVKVCDADVAGVDDMLLDRDETTDPIAAVLDIEICPPDRLLDKLTDEGADCVDETWEDAGCIPFEDVEVATVTIFEVRDVKSDDPVVCVLVETKIGETVVPDGEMPEERPEVVVDRPPLPDAPLVIASEVLVPVEVESEIGWEELELPIFSVVVAATM